MNFDLIPVKFDRFERFAHLYQECFGIAVSENYFRWKYLENPTGPVVAYEAVSDGKSMAFYGVIPEPYLADGKPLAVYQSMDTMTHPLAQKRGLFTRLSLLTYEKLEKEQGALRMVGIPGPQSYPGFMNKLAWQNPHTFTYTFTHRAALGVTSALWNARARHEARRVTTMEPGLREYLERADEAVTRARPGTPEARFQLRLRPDFFAWRVFGHPYRGYRVWTATRAGGGEVRGVCVAVLGDKERLSVQWLSTAPDASASERAAIAGALLTEASQSTSAAMVYTWRPLNAALAATLRRLGFVHNPAPKGPFSYRVPFITRAQPPEVAGRAWSDIRNFDLQPIMQD